MNELKEWPLSLLLAAVFLAGAAITLPISIGYLFAPGLGWLTLTAELALFAKQAHGIYMEEREYENGHNS